MGRLLFNQDVVCDVGGPGPSRAPLDFHRRLPGYEPTPLHRLPTLASRLGAGDVLLKDESNRLGLPAFKILGASWAAYRAVVQLLGHEPTGWSTVEELQWHLEAARPLELVTATDGNHGRAVARIAALLGFGARIFVPSGTAEARIAAIESEGAEVIVVDGTYDEAVSLAAEERSERALVIQDTSWSGYEQIPNWVIEGYSTMFWEIDDALTAVGEPGPDLVVVQVGVGSLAAAVVRHYRRVGVTPCPRIVAVEPTSAACALAAMDANSIVTLSGPHDSIMAGLNCGTLATLAWPLLKAGIDCFMTVEDERAREGTRELAGVGVVSGESGSAGLAAMMELTDRPDAEALCRRLELGATSRVLIISTEGATDPHSYEETVGRSALAVRNDVG